MTDGELVRDGDTYVLRFERRLAHPVERVWEAITEPKGLEAWFPSAVDLELRVGGKLIFTNDPDFDVDPELLATTGEVIELEPRRRFAFTWGNDLLRFELSPTADGCVLVFSHRLSHRAMVNRTASGWAVCLDSLTAALAGTKPASPGWRHYYDANVERFGDDGVVSREEGTTVLRFERLMEAPKERVRAAVDGLNVNAHDGVVKTQLIPIEDCSLLLLTETVEGEWDATEAIASWDRELVTLADRLAGADPTTG